MYLIYMYRFEKLSFDENTHYTLNDNVFESQDKPSQVTRESHFNEM